MKRKVEMSEHEKGHRYDDFERIPLHVLTINAPIGFDLFLYQDGRFQKLAASNLILKKSMILRLLETGWLYGFVRKSDRALYKRYLEENMTKLLSNETLALDEKSVIIYDTATDIMENLFENPTSGELIERSKVIASSVMDRILIDRKAFLSLMRISSYDYYTYTHCVNVAIYAIGLGRQIHLEKGDLKALGHGAILHDLGKSRIDAQIVNKAGPLSEEEFGEMTKHSLLGCELLQGLGETDERILGIIRSHHEKYEGGGYPDGLAREEIPLFAQIVAIADVFDALTTRRSYKEPLNSFQALRIMRQKMTNHFNQELLAHFVLLMGARWE